MSIPASCTIHPSAVIDPGAVLGENVRVGAFTLIGADVSIGDGCDIGPHCTVTGPTRIGKGNRFVGHAAIGGDPQDKKYAGERTELEIGENNLFREFITINRGTGGGGGVTRIGHDNWMLAYTHIAERMDYYRVSAAQVLAAFDAQVRLVDIAPKVAYVCKDADDQKFIDLAAAHRAILLSKDKAVICMRKRLANLGADVATEVVLGVDVVCA